MPKLTLNQAAKEAKKAKSTILEAIRSGKLSANKGLNGNYAIEPAELFRVYPLEPTQTEQENQNRTGINQQNPQENTLKTAVLEKEVEFLKREINRLEATQADLKADRDEWRGQATQLLLTNQTEKSSQLTTEKEQNPKDHKTLKQVLYFIVLVASVLLAYGLGKMNQLF